MWPDIDFIPCGVGKVLSDMHTGLCIPLLYNELAQVPFYSIIMKVDADEM